MPTYEYECSACGEVFESFQSITAEPLESCELCGSKRVKRLIGMGAGIIFKGSGFYETDYRSQDYKEKAKAERNASSAKPSEKKDKSSTSNSGKSSTESGGKSGTSGTSGGSGKTGAKAK